MPLYPVYALLFADTGLSGGEIASLFALWSLVGLVAEVPSGALADRIPRRHLLVASGFVRAAGFALWVVLPGYPAFAAGFVLWGSAGALRSGTLEALTYDELHRLGAGDRYAAVRARTGAAELVAVVVAGTVAAPLLVVGGYPLLGAVSVAGCFVQVAVATRLPLGRPPGDDYKEALRSGVREALTQRPVRRLVVFGALLGGVLAVDEFVPLLLRDAGLGDALIALAGAAIPLAAAAGSAAAERLPRRGVVVTALAGSAVVVAAASAFHALAGLAALGAWFGAVELARVLADVRLQASITGSARATVTSVVGVGEELAGITMFVLYGAMLGVVPVATVLFVGVTVPTLLLAATVAAGRPGLSPARRIDEAQRR